MISWGNYFIIFVAVFGPIDKRLKSQPSQGCISRVRIPLGSPISEYSHLRMVDEFILITMGVEDFKKAMAKRHK